MERCFFDKETKCAVLTHKRCGKCSFRKTYSELIRGRKAAEERIMSLPPSIQRHIMDKYYSGGGCHNDIHDTDDF